MRWMSGLAADMERHGKEIFHIEDLQPTWIARGGWLSVYIVLTRVVACLVFLTPVAYYWGIFRGDPALSEDAFFFSLAGGLLTAVIDLSRARSPFLWKWWAKLPRLLRWTIDLAILVGLYILMAPTYPSLGQEYLFVKMGLLLALIWGIRDTKPSCRDDIRLLERFPVSVTTYRAQLRSDFRWFRWILAAIFVVAGIAIFLMMEEAKTLALLAGAVSLAVVSVFLAVTLVRATDARIASKKSMPNQGVFLTLRNCAVAGLVFAVIPWIGMFASTLVLQLGVHTASEYAAAWSIFALLVGIAWYGGLDVLRHYLLRLTLSLTGQLPLFFAPFLEFATQRLKYLQRSGGGYIFIHRYLQSYFAKLGDE